MINNTEERLEEAQRRTWLGEVAALEESLQHLEEEFDPAFVRIHRNCLVAREAISGFERNSEESESGWAVVIRATGEKLPVSRRQHHVVKQFK